MRRSKAPSQRGAITPLHSSPGFKKPSVNVKVEPKPEKEYHNSQEERETEEKEEIHKQTEEPAQNQPQPPIKKRKLGGSLLRPSAFTAPPPTTDSSPRKNSSTPCEETDPKTIGQVFSVMHCKWSRKKHKVYEDGILLVQNRKKCILKDMTGKDLSKSQFGKTQSLSDGATLNFGGKEIEICSELPVDDYISGKIFMGVQQSTGGLNLGKPLQSRPFTNPSTSNTRSPLKKKPVSLKPLFDPTSPGALVLHQSYKSDRVSVVVDPFIGKWLRPHQREGVKFLYTCVMGEGGHSGSGCILADEMGLGKTLQCITLIWTLMKQGVMGSPTIRRAVVVTPSSLTKNWKKEFGKWLSPTRLDPICIGDGKEKAKVIIQEWKHAPVQRSVLIISYEQFRQHYKQIVNVDVGLVICDEGHRLKNAGSQISKALCLIRSTRRVILSGTPVQNDLEEFYTMCMFVNPGVLGDISTFKQVFMNPIERGRDANATTEDKQISSARIAKLHETTKLFVIRRTADILEKYLPPKIEKIVFCPLTSLQTELYTHYLRSADVYNVLQANGSGATALEAIMNLRKLCNHPALSVERIKEVTGKNIPNGECLDKEKHQPEHSAKLQILEKILLYLKAETTDRVVLVSLFRKTLDLFELMCKKNNFSFLRLDGSVVQSKRQALVDSFNDKGSKTFIFLLSSKAGGVGFNLVGANRIFLYDGDWNPATDQQAMARIWRDGQNKTVHIYRLLCAGTIDEKIYQRQISKIGLSKQMVDEEVDDTRSSFTLEELKDIFSLNSTTKCDTHDLTRCGCDLEGGDSVRPDQGEKKNEKISSQVLRMRHFAKKYPDPALLKNKSIVSFMFQFETKLEQQSNDIVVSENECETNGHEENGFEENGFEENGCEEDNDLLPVPSGRTLKRKREIKKEKGEEKQKKESSPTGRHQRKSRQPEEEDFEDFEEMREGEEEMSDWEDEGEEDQLDDAVLGNEEGEEEKEEEEEEEEEEEKEEEEGEEEEKEKEEKGEEGVKQPRRKKKKNQFFDLSDDDDEFDAF